MTLTDLTHYSLLTFALLAVCSVGPGLFFVRYLRWTRLETLGAAVAGSVLFVGLGSMLIFAVNLRPVAAFHWGLTGVCLALDVICWRDLRRLWRSALVRGAVGVLGAVCVWTGLLVSLIRHFGGGRWWGDWFAHYQRALIFAGYLPRDFQLIRGDRITNRPPLMNLVCGHYVALLEPRFALYQWVVVFLNVLPVLPCVLFAVSAVGRDRRARRAMWPVLTLLLMASPMFAQNVTFLWTKPLAAFFAMLGVWFYLRGWMKRDGTRLVAGFLLVTAGCLVHFSIVPWLGVLGAHYLLVVWPRRPRRGAELLAIGASGTALAATWFGWAIATYGAGAALHPDLSVEGNGGGHVVVLGRWCMNVFWTIVPYFLRPVPYVTLRQNENLGLIRDLAFNLYQTNAIFALGSAGAVVLAFVILSRALAWERWPGGLARFWVWFCVLTILLGLAIVPASEQWGAAQFVMVPYVPIALVVLAGVLPRLRRAWQLTLLLGCTIDFVVGILLHVHLENQIFPIVAAADPSQISYVGGSLSEFALGNYMLKVYAGLSYVGDTLVGAAVGLQVALCAVFVVVLFRAAIALRIR